MKEYTIYDRIKDFIWFDRIRAVEYYFAKKWLNKNFGEHEYWGEVISEWKNTFENRNEQDLDDCRVEFAKEVTKDWTIKQIADYWCNKLK